MTDLRFTNIRATIERCHRLAATAGDEDARGKLLELAERLELSLREPNTTNVNDGDSGE